MKLDIFLCSTLVMTLGTAGVAADEGGICHNST